MAKIHVYMLALIVWILLFHFAGLIEGTGTSYILNNLGVTNPENFGSTQFYAILIGVLSVTAVGVAIGVLYGRSSDLVFLASTIAFTSVMILMLWDFVVLANALRATNHYIAVLLISGLMVVYGLTIYEWVRGMST